MSSGLVSEWTGFIRQNLGYLWERKRLTFLCSSPYSVGEIKMEDILAVLAKDDCFKRRQRGAQVSASYLDGDFMCALCFLVTALWVF